MASDDDSEPEIVEKPRKLSGSNDYYLQLALIAGGNALSAVVFGLLWLACQVGTC